MVCNAATAPRFGLQRHNITWQNDQRLPSLVLDLKSNDPNTGFAANRAEPGAQRVGIKIPAIRASRSIDRVTRHARER